MRSFTLIFLLCTALCGSKAIAQQQAKVIKFDALEQLMKTNSGKVQVINFWATWCAPCIKELPHFEALNAAHSEVNVTLISLDFSNKLDRVNNFIAKKNLQSAVLLLDEIDYNSWIDKVDPSWSGAIPATLFINHKTGQRKFVERELKEGELEELVSNLMIN